MGLDFSHCDAHWGYIRFMRFRIKLAAEIGVFLPAMDRFYDPGNPCTEFFKRPHVGCPISWEAVDDPIKTLLNHSDCDGELTPEECREVAPRLRELVAGWDDNDHDKVEALKLADGMEAAARENEALRFC